MSDDDPTPAGTDESASAEPSFEQALAQLEVIVDRLEEGDLELEQALADFERGVKLTRRCAGELSSAERRIELLVREGEKWLAQPFRETELDDASDDASDDDGADEA